MTDLSTISDDALMSEVARRELHKRNGVFALMSEQQLHYHGIVANFGDRLRKLMMDDSARYWRVNAEWLAAVDAHSPSYQPGPLNTTYRGAEDRIHEIARAA